jgi:hypothetical protein
MKIKRLVLAMSLVGLSSAASAASDVAAVSQPDAVIFQSQVSSAVQLSATVQSGTASATVTGAITPTATASMSGSMPAVTAVVSSIATPPAISAVGFASSSALVTQDALGLVVVPEGTVLTSGNAP